MPVPASPSGGAITAPACNVPVGSSHAAPRSVRTPAFSPALSTVGSFDSSGPYFASKAFIMRALYVPVAGSIGNMPLASPTPITFSPVRR